MSLDDEGNVFALYEESFPLVVKFFLKLQDLISCNNLKFTNHFHICEHHPLDSMIQGDYVVRMSLKQDPCDLPADLMQIFRRALSYTIRSGNKDITVMDSNAKNYYLANLFIDGTITKITR
jgi:hypothetical protein